MLTCIFCGGPAKIKGKCAGAKVTCARCGMSVDPEKYRDQIQNWQEAVCKVKTDLTGPS